MRISKKKVLFTVVLMAFGSVLPASAARRDTTNDPPPPTGTIDKPVFSPV